MSPEPDGRRPPEATATVDPPGSPETRPQAGQADFTSSEKWRGGAWAILGFGGGQAIRFASNLVMTRLLFREAFGLMQIINAFLLGLQLFTDLGLSQSVVQNARGEDRSFRHTAWTLQIVRGVALTAVAVALAGAVASFYGNDALRPMIMACAVTLLIRSSVSTAMFIAKRRMNVKSVAIIELSSQSCGIAATITYAVISPTPWAFVAGAITGSLVLTALSHLMLGWRESFAWDRNAVRAIMSFGSWVFVSTLLMFLASQSDRLIFGKLIPLGLLGVYGLAQSAVNIPVQMLGKLVESVVFPVFCRTVNQGGDLGADFRAHRAKVSAVGGWALSGMCGGATLIIGILYDSRYADAGWMLRILAMGCWFAGVLEKTRSAGIIARGLPRLLAISNTAKLVGMVVFVPIGFSLWGFEGAVAAYASSDFLKYLMSARNGARLGLGDIRGDLTDTMLFACAVTVSILAVDACDAAGVPRLLQCVVVAAVDTAVWSYRLSPLFRRVWTRLFAAR